MRWRPAVAMAGMLVAVGCGSDDPSDEAEDPPPTTAVDERSDESHPFTVGDPPEGFVVRSAGRGTYVPEWGEDCCGTAEPYLVLSPDGTPDHPDVVVVTLTGYQGYQGGLDQASTGYGTAEVVEVDGEEGRYHSGEAGPHDPTHRWADLVVAQGDADLAIRVASPEATQDELAALVERVVVPDDRTQPPAVPDPPEGLEVVGSVDAHAVVTGYVLVGQQADGGPGGATGHGIGWLPGHDRDRGEPLVVVALPARSADLDALAVGLRWQEERYGRTATVGRDGDAVLFESAPDEGGTLDRAVWAPGPEGDVVVVAARGEDPPAHDELLALARSVAPTDEATWDAFVDEVVAADPSSDGDGAAGPDGAGGVSEDDGLVVGPSEASGDEGGSSGG